MTSQVPSKPAGTTNAAPGPNCQRCPCEFSNAIKPSVKQQNSDSEYRMRHLPGELDQRPAKNCCVESVKKLAMVCRGCPEMRRSAAGSEFSAATVAEKSTIWEQWLSGMRTSSGRLRILTRRTRKTAARLERAAVPERASRSVAGEGCARLEPDLDAAFEGLVIGDGFRAREALA